MTPTSYGANRLPLPLVLLVGSAVLIGVLNLVSAGRVARPNLYLVQMAWLSVGVLCAYAIMLLSREWLRRLSAPVYIFVLGLLVSVLLFGVTVKGAQRWLSLGFANLQPSELAKVAVLLVMAFYMGHYPIPEGGLRLADVFRPLNISRPLGLAVVLVVGMRELELRGVDVPSGGIILVFVLGAVWMILSIVKLVTQPTELFDIVAPIDLLVLPAVLILKQPDLGTTLMVVAVGFTQLLACGFRRRALMTGLALSIVGALGAWHFVLLDYQKQRVLNFLEPELDVQGAGYHAAQSMIAIGSGQTFGKGFGQGTQTQLSFLPENQTDFVFAVWGEEWGFLGGLLLIAILMSIPLYLLNLAARSEDRVSMLLHVGAAGMVFWHASVNLLMVMGFAPVVGVTLPFISYGGSSLLTLMIALGFSLHAYKHQAGRRLHA